MNPVNATSLYISANRLVLNCDPGDPQSFSELYKLLPYFRQSLSCCVCGNLLQDPIAPTNSTCQHYVCKGCKGKKMMMKPSCSWCKDYECFEENKQLSILVNCYKKLCEYIAESPLAQHIVNPVDDTSDILALLNEGLSFGEEIEGPSSENLTLGLPTSEAPSTSEKNIDSETNCSQTPESTHYVDIGSSDINGLPDCNGVSVDEINVNISSPENPNTIDVCSTGEELKSESVSNSLQPVCETVSSSDLSTAGIDICCFSEDMRPGDPLLLSVEEVLQSLDTESNSEVCDSNLQPNLEVGAPNGSFPDAKPSSLPPNSVFISSSTPSHGISCTAATPKVVRLNRKRSRSESDSEKVQPLPISSIIRGPTLGAAAPVPIKRESKVHIQPVATLPNGGTPKVNKTLPVSNKSVKKNLEHGAKKSHPKVKQRPPKTKDRLKDRIPSNNIMPGSPTKTVYKKPQEKKGCKCGRATQNPSVLTCRGQRCPCYSNRKACLDCICRGCQNSYMANGEKKLEAFAVPEKALEQTRLTLGINVTSIAVRNASTSASVINVTGSPVTTFLAASPHDDKSFEEALDMRYDC
ncbi:E3 ubiquitin-protein ligase MSL2 [Latimeria chalumnae]|nr:PREDICTED: E3 ubiquitin-protein ligase MSL2 [Latimeria chalumnae]XP_014341164.1 PREDICTED: E3 ubiquitin-protein ligase MSL2 [Latimeria chalumnae]|eukprot:XP_005991246.1 PREDICTED: E3 ubiquitin-protein ligase MSL2 [Latimeria chalumnae]